YPSEIVSLRGPGCSPLHGGARLEIPVIFPRGWARLQHNPAAIGSFTCAITMGIVALAFFAALMAPAPSPTITSTLSRTSSAAKSGYRAELTGVVRYSKIMFLLST